MAKDIEKNDLLKRIKSIKNRLGKVTTELQTLAMDVLTHTSKCGDVTVLDKLNEALGYRQDGKTLARVKAFHAWVSAFSPCSFREKAGEFRIKKGWKTGDFDLEGAEEVPFWEYTRERRPVKMDVEKCINAFVRNLTKARDQGNMGEYTSVHGILADAKKALATFDPTATPHTEDEAATMAEDEAATMADNA